MILQPSEERRRSGSHYTPRELTEPIVRGRSWSRFCGACINKWRGTHHGPNGFSTSRSAIPRWALAPSLVEACRQLGDALDRSPGAPTTTCPTFPPDEDEVIYARAPGRAALPVRRGPQCGGGGPHEALALAGDAREGASADVPEPCVAARRLARGALCVQQIEAFHWEGGSPPDFRHGGSEQNFCGNISARVGELREHIRNAGEDTSDWEVAPTSWDKAQGTRRGKVAHCFGDLALAAFFEGKTEKAEREQLPEANYTGAVLKGEADSYRRLARGLEPPVRLRRSRPIPLGESSFRRCSSVENRGFDAIVGNPPFAGKNTDPVGQCIAGYPDWLKELHAGSHGNADLVAHFFRRAFNLLKRDRRHVRA